MEANHEFKEHGGEEFRAIPCLNIDSEWCQTVGNWINEWATVEKQQLKWLFLKN
jgi:ferrochelatase